MSSSFIPSSPSSRSLKRQRSSLRSTSSSSTGISRQSSENGMNYAFPSLSQKNAGKTAVVPPGLSAPMIRTTSSRGSSRRSASSDYEAGMQVEHVEHADPLVYYSSSGRDNFKDTSNLSDGRYNGPLYSPMPRLHVQTTALAPGVTMVDGAVHFTAEALEVKILFDVVSKDRLYSRNIEIWDADSRTYWWPIHIHLKPKDDRFANSHSMRKLTFPLPEVKAVGLTCSTSMCPWRFTTSKASSSSSKLSALVPWMNEDHQRQRQPDFMAFFSGSVIAKTSGSLRDMVKDLEPNNGIHVVSSWASTPIPRFASHARKSILENDLRGWQTMALLPISGELCARRPSRQLRLSACVQVGDEWLEVVDSMTVSHLTVDEINRGSI